MPLVSSLKIGTRKSPLALAQAEEVRARMMHAHPGLEIEIVPMVTTGDRLLDKSLAEEGGKGLFTKEIEEALLRGEVDIAVHSAKDMPTVLPDGLVIACVPPREDVRDVLIGAESIEALPQGARLGTSSLRRAAQVLRVRPDIRIVPLRGNVETRLRKIEAGEADATLLALAGLKRLKLTPLPGVPLPVDELLPAPAQGALALECRAEGARMQELLAPLNDMASQAAITAERALLKALDGSCRTPIAAYAQVADGMMTLRGMLLSPDGRDCMQTMMGAPLVQAEQLGTMVGQELLD